LQPKAKRANLGPAGMVSVGVLSFAEEAISIKSQAYGKGKCAYLNLVCFGLALD